MNRHCMKTISLAALGLATSFCVATLCAVEEPVRLRVTPTADGSYMIEGSVDLLAFSKPAVSARQVRKAETQARRQNMGALEVAADHVKYNWGKYAAVITAVAVDRVAEHNDWLYYKWGSDSDNKTAGGNVSGDSASTSGSTQTTVTGNNNTVNQITVIQQPAAGGSDANVGDRAGAL